MAPPKRQSDRAEEPVTIQDTIKLLKQRRQSRLAQRTDAMPNPDTVSGQQERRCLRGACPADRQDQSRRISTCQVDINATQQQERRFHPLNAQGLESTGQEGTLNPVSRTRDDTQVLVKTLTGTTVTPDVEASDTIDKVKD